jgi:5'-nucleotidase / UDP-sugar diphosphatase
MVYQVKADFAFQNKGGIRISSIPAGDIRLSEIYKLDPFGNLIVTYRMTLKEIQSLICYSYKREKGIDLEVSGMTYTILADSSNNCTGVEMSDKSGNPLDETKTYIVALNSYVAASYHFDHADAGTTINCTSAQALINYLKEIKKADYKGTKRVFLKKENLPGKK